MEIAALVMTAPVQAQDGGGQKQGAQEEIPPASQSREFLKSGDVTGFVGYRFGGSVFIEDFGFDVELGPELSYGFKVDVNFSEITEGHFFLEALFSTQKALVNVASTGTPDLELGDTHVRYFHGGIGFEWGRSSLRPFWVGTVGVTRFSPVPEKVRGTTEFSTGFGGGLKVLLNEHIGARIDARMFATRTGVTQTSFWCAGIFGCGGAESNLWLWQGDLTVGILVGF